MEARDEEILKNLLPTKVPFMPTMCECPLALISFFLTLITRAKAYWVEGISAHGRFLPP
jgi:hypothetical protein